MKHKNSLETLLDEIKIKTGDNLDHVAEKVGKSRPYISKKKNQENEDDSLLKLVQTVRHKYAKELEEKIPDEKIIYIESAISVLLSELSILKSALNESNLELERKKIEDAIFSISEIHLKKLNNKCH